VHNIIIIFPTKM